MNKLLSIRNYLQAGLLMTVFMFVFSVSTLVLNNRVSEVVGAGAVSSIYIIGLVCKTVGFLLYAGSFVIIRKRAMRCMMRSVVLVLLFVLYLWLMIGIPAEIYGFGCAIWSILIGFAGGMSFHLVAMWMRGEEHIGLLVGGAHMLAVCIQVVCQNALSRGWLIGIIQVAWCVLFFYSVKTKDEKEQNGHAIRKLPKITLYQLLFPLAVIAVISMINGVFDGIVTIQNVAQKIHLTGNIRLLLGVSELIAGIVFDKFRWEKMTLVTLCAATVATLGNVLLLEGAFQTSMALYYSSMGFYIIYLSLYYIEKATYTEHPEFWASLGRAFQCFVSAVATIPIPYMIKHMSEAGLMAYEMIFVLALFVLFYFQTVKGRKVISKEESKFPVRTFEEQITIFAADFGLTIREKEVLAVYVANNLPQKEMAEQLCISTRTLQRHIASIKEKTNTQGQMELAILFREKVVIN